MNNDWQPIQVHKDVHKKVKLQAAQAGLKMNDYIKYLLNLGQAYPPTIDYKKTEDNK